MKFILYTFILGMALLTGQSSLAQSSSRAVVSGQVRTSDGTGLPFATVALKNTQYGVMAGENGDFKLEAPAGTYSLVVTYAGYSIFEHPLRLEKGESVVLENLIVEVPSNQLREVVVEDIQTNKFANRESVTAARMPLANLENPQLYSVVRRELMQEQIAIDYNTALRSVAGAVVTNGVNDSGNDIIMRGFRGQSTFRNGLAMDPRTQSEIANIEKVEVLKGPSGTLFGGKMAGYGGVVNNITKKPFESYRGEVGYTTGSWGLNRLTFDLNTPLNADRTALIRINGAGHMENSFQDQGYAKNLFLAASLAFKPNDRTTVRLDADVYSSERPLLAYTRTTPGLTATSITALDIPYFRSLSSNDIGTRRSTINTAVTLEYQLSDHWSSQTTYLHSASGDKESIFFVPFYLSNEMIQRRFRIFEFYTNTTDNIQQNFIGDFKAGRFKNRVVVGGDIFHRSNQGQEMNPFFQIYDTVSVHAPFWTPLSRFDIEQYRAARSQGSQSYSSRYTSYGLYASDVLNLTERLMVMLSLRLDHYRQPSTIDNGIAADNAYHQTFLSPKLGIVYQPVKDKVSLFANYLNAFNNLGPSLGVTNADNPGEQPTLRNWKAEEANQWEGGLKVELFDGKLSSTISYYSIEVSNRLRSLGDVSIQDGTQISKGIDIEVVTNPFRGLNLVAGYGYNDNEYVLDTDAQKGKRAPWTPVNTANFWASYKILDGGAKGLGFGFGVNHVDKSYFDVNEKFSVPAYTLANATFFYDQPKYRVGVKLNNIGDVHYWDFYGKPQKPREFVAGVSYKF